jgi:uncharacterized membrane protein
MINVTCYYLEGQAESDRVISLLREISQQVEFGLVLIDIDKDPALRSNFETRVPVVRIGPYTLSEEITRQKLEISIAAAKERSDDLQQIGDETYRRRILRGRKFSWADQLANWLTNHYLLLFNTLLAAYVGFAFLAPVFMKIGFEPGAKVLYTIYSPFCHQLAFRSWFLFGEQAYYPRNLADIPGVLTYEAITNQGSTQAENSDQFILGARSFLGNDTLGYKTAICERDIALYGSIFLFGIVYSLFKRKLKQIPWYFWLLLGFLPIAIDGLSQLPGLIPGLPAFLPDRESNPILRSLTGGLFGFLTAWYLYPLIEESMQETRAVFTSKQMAINQLNMEDKNR